MGVYCPVWAGRASKKPEKKTYCGTPTTSPIFTKFGTLDGLLTLSSVPILVSIGWGVLFQNGRFLYLPGTVNNGALHYCARMSLLLKSDQFKHCVKDDWISRQKLQILTSRVLEFSLNGAQHDTTRRVLDGILSSVLAEIPPQYACC